MVEKNNIENVMIGSYNACATVAVDQPSHTENEIGIKALVIFRIMNTAKHSPQFNRLAELLLLVIYDIG